MDSFSSYPQPAEAQKPFPGHQTQFQDVPSHPFFDVVQEQSQQMVSKAGDPQVDFDLQPGTPVPAPTTTAPLSGFYSSSGFDMIGILSRLVNRPNPQINVGPIDMSCSFLVTDARQYDHPIVYCSPTFEHLTGYKGSEILGRNCRFLQAPDGRVTSGSRRQHTDNQAVYHLKAQMLQSNEHQASIINYRKGGQAFVNLITVIPICNEFNEVAFFVGLQVDLVEQPNAILEKMKDGTYLVNYQQMNMVPYIPGANTASEPVDDYFREIPAVASPASEGLNNQEILDLVQCSGENEQQLQQEWNKLLLEHSEDFIHVLSLKGFFLYCSRSSSDLLEHDPEELVGHSLSSICHPSDIVPVMREIKEAAGNSDKVVNLIYRVRRKYSGYMWMECQGKLHVDQSKGRKCLILAGRERPMYSLPRKELMQYGGAGVGSEFWVKASLSGLYLHVSGTSEDVVGYSSDFLVGASIFRYVLDKEVHEITRALASVKKGEICNLEHTMQNNKGQYVSVVSTFYPGDGSSGNKAPEFALIQIRAKDAAVLAAIKSAADDVAMSDMTEEEVAENMFSELETVRGTSWQYELHQLEVANQKLREQLENLSNPKRRKQKKKKASSAPDVQKMCAQCQSKDSPEWRKGPNGPKELCNACGLRYAKSISAKTTAMET
ncbi:GATA-type zinc finger transcription factor [Phycomyces blakesleeanus]|uniref:GATA-type zinc finger transcription factor n=2 Tax=Phycomyces blakesleeanus TaxID=4837 RepID=A0A167JAR0_PHYB8|nr:GATA-type zinc finger transcription factor [Phycomyces blakesleeanus NRRL 1555(-)]ABB77846.1 MADA [Phycomyces blakesleeanus]OAD65617.1 GATA-type zinc finger transcription factor [Phycomyces blakesleeanus NRRL 1555(-)]|eukprot:XP_018283657.1 GATA-type zinc finger transcription factor [Phycomyces blakesleeanus NRRL 1555(-)]